MKTDAIPALCDDLNRPTRARIAWRLRFEKGWPLKRVARRLGISTQAAHQLVARYAARRLAPSQRPRRIIRRYLQRPYSLSTQIFT